MIDALKNKSGKREYALIGFVVMLWLIYKSAQVDGEQALATFKAASPFLTGIIAWGTGWKAMEQLREAGK